MLMERKTPGVFGVALLGTTPVTARAQHSDSVHMHAHLCTIIVRLNPNNLLHGSYFVAMANHELVMPTVHFIVS